MKELAWVAWPALLALLIAGPWFASGYFFATDFPGPRRISFPDVISSSAPLEAALAILAAAVSAQVAAKLLILSALFGAAFAAYRCLPTGGFVPRAVASTVYLMNPFVYGRLQYGHLFLLAGYALFPWAASCVRQIVQRPTRRGATIGAAATALLGMLEVHLLIPLAVLSVAAGIAGLLGNRQRLRYIRDLCANLALALLLVVVASSYWLIPLLLGSGLEARTIGASSQADVNAYSAVGDPKLGLLPNLLGLYGFWAEATGRFTSMKDFVPLWPIALGALLVVAAIGVVAVLRQDSGSSFEGARPWVTALLIASAIGLVFEIGVSDNHVAPMIRWLDDLFPPFRGLRDAGKWSALLALVYSQLVPLGVIVLLHWVRLPFRGRAVADVAQPLVVGLALALPIYYGNGLLFGMHREIQVSQYPAGWYAADQAVSSGQPTDRVLFLPWHLYMSLSFVRNQDDVVASPAQAFFSAPVVVSHNPEIVGVSPPRDSDQVAIDQLLSGAGASDWANGLAERRIKYVLLAREADWQQYSYLDHQKGLVRVGDYGSIVVYRAEPVP
jgi:hypothetical protein